MIRHIITILALAALAGAAWAQPAPDDPPEPGVGLTIYNQNFGIVRDDRRLDLAEGVGPLTIRNIPETIVPETVQFFSLTDPEGTRVVEQNYEFDLVGAAKLLDKYIDRALELFLDDGSTLRGQLLSFDGGQLVLDTGQGIAIVPRGDNIKTIRFESLPEGLMTRPALVWQIEARRGGAHAVRIAYRANNMTWRCDYRVLASPDLNTIALGGWVTVTNNSGATFTDAALKLMAGDVHVVEELARRELADGMMQRARAPAAPAFEEKAFADYRLYTLQHPTTLKGRETKQIHLITVEGVPVQKRYECRNGGPVQTILEFKNSAETAEGLGIPLPKGKVRLFTEDHDGAEEYLSETSIDHTPRNEQVRIPAGVAFDIAAERTLVNQRSLGQRASEATLRVRLRNHKDEPVAVKVFETMQHMDWTIVNASHEHQREDVRTALFDIDIAANAELTVTYTVRYQW